MTDRGVHSFPMRAYLDDSGAFGVDFSANYLKFVEQARIQFLRELCIENSLEAEETV